MVLGGFLYFHENCQFRFFPRFETIDLFKIIIIIIIIIYIYIYIYIYFRLIRIDQGITLTFFLIKLIFK